MSKSNPPHIDPKLKKALSNKYDIIEEVGSGGMAVVYKAIQKTLDRTVALKVVHQNFVHDKEFIDRFTKEARVAASLNHPNIVTIHDVDSIGQFHYMTMEHLDGEPLSEKVRKRGRLGINETLKIILNVAKALNYLHKKGYIHRDVKSSNIFVNTDGRAVLMDFGIVFTSESMLSQPGTVLGTPEFMSPEQANGNELSGRSDLYSLGVIMYECLTAKMPFRTDNPLTTVYKVINEAPRPINEINPKIPEWLNSQVLNLLSKNPSDRVQSGIELAQNLVNKKVVPFDFGNMVISKDSVTKKPNDGKTMKLGQAQTDTQQSPDRTIVSGPMDAEQPTNQNNSFIKLLYVIAALLAIGSITLSFLLKLPDPAIGNNANTSEEVALTVDESEVYRKVSQHPYFPGGSEAFKNFVKKQISESGQNFEGGTVYIQAIIGINGEVLNPTILKGISARQDAVALDVVKSLPSFVAGQNEGSLVKAVMVLPVEFD